jgi:hypothetical protein
LIISNNIKHFGKAKWHEQYMRSWWNIQRLQQLLHFHHASYAKGHSGRCGPRHQLLQQPNASRREGVHFCITSPRLQNA